MRSVERFSYREVNWAAAVIAVLLSLTGIAFVASACLEPGGENGWSREALMQATWFCLALLAGAVCLHIPLRVWRAGAFPAYVLGLAVQMVMILAAGTALVPAIKGQCNWLRLGPIGVQPSEFIKLAVLLAVARVLTMPQVDAGRLVWVAVAGLLGGVPLLLLAREDLGSAITFVPLLVGVLIIAGMRLRWLIAGGLAGCAVIATVVGWLVTRPDANENYLSRRLLAFWQPEAYALTESYQSIRAVRSIGSGQLFGKGYGAGPQNNLDWLPEEHTDMIFAVIGEESGFVGAAVTVLLFLVLGLMLLWTAGRCRDRFGQLVIGGFACLVFGQACINLAVVTDLMPVTGVTLPFISYGGSSLLALFIGLGMCLGLGAARSEDLGLSVTSSGLRVTRRLGG
jgi:rod shape determining protein RodA